LTDLTALADKFFAGLFAIGSLGQLRGSMRPRDRDPLAAFVYRIVSPSRWRSSGSARIGAAMAAAAEKGQQVVATSLMRFMQLSMQRTSPRGFGLLGSSNRVPVAKSPGQGVRWCGIHCASHGIPGGDWYSTG